MSVESGKDGTVYIGASEETPVTDWTLTRTVASAPYVANDTGGVTKRKAGAGDSSGSFNMADKPSFNEGDEVTFFGWDGSTSYTVAVLITSIVAVANFAGTAVSGHAVSFEGNGAITIGSGSNPA
jgi:hypothetical protein